MSKESAVFLREIHRLISSITDSVIGVFDSSSDSDFVEFTEDEMQIITNMKLTDAQFRVIKKAISESQRSLIFNMLCMIDGVSYTNENIPDLAIVDRSTGEPINHDYLHDEFYEVLSEE